MEAIRQLSSLLDDVKHLSSNGKYDEARLSLKTKILPAVRYGQKCDHSNLEMARFLTTVEDIVQKLSLHSSYADRRNVDNAKRFRVELPLNSIQEQELDKFSAGRKSIIESTILSSKDGLMSCDFNLVGLHEAKCALDEAIVEPIKFPNWFTNGRKPWRCILLYGPPGTGKSRLAHLLSKQLPQGVVYHVSSADIVSSWMGQSEQLIRDLFHHAINCGKPALIFIDEIDSLCRIRCSNEEETSRRIKTQLLIQIQRICEESSQVFLLGATNCPWDIDTAFLRRFQKRIYVGLPNEESRIELLRSLLPDGQIDSAQWSLIGDKTDGMTGNDLCVLVQEVLHRPLREMKVASFWQLNDDDSWSPAFKLEGSYRTCLKETFTTMVQKNFVLKPRAVLPQDVLEALKVCQKTVVQGELEKFYRFTQQFGVFG